MENTITVIPLRMGTDDIENQAKRERNEARVKKLIRKMGTAYCCHKKNRVKRLPELKCRSVLGRGRS
jgi:hypothetical protein